MMFDYFKFYTNRARLAPNVAERNKFLKMAEKYKPEEPKECSIDSCELTEKPKRGRKKKGT